MAAAVARTMPSASVAVRATTLTLLVGLLAVLIASVWSITVGASSTIDPWTALTSLFVWDGSPAHVTVQSLRLPRVVVAVLVGASLAVSGALIQGVTRNPLAEPSIIGVNAGAVVIVAALLAGPVTVLSLGDDVARGLGQDVERVRLVAFGLVVVLAGAAVAVAGPIAMVGLMVPHIVRRMVGVDYRAVIPCSAVLGA